MLDKDLEILLYQSYCKLFRTPEPFTTTEQMLKHYCKTIIEENKSTDLQVLINYKLGEITKLFDLPELPFSVLPNL